MKVSITNHGLHVRETEKSYHVLKRRVSGPQRVLGDKITKALAGPVPHPLHLRLGSHISIYKWNELFPFREPASRELRTEDYTTDKAPTGYKGLFAGIL